MERGRIEFRSERVLLVEGTNDKAFFEALLAKNGRRNVQVESYGGKTALRARLATAAAQDDFQIHCRWLGVCRDCDDDPRGAHHSLRDALNAAGLPYPRSGNTDEARDTMLSVRILLLPNRTEKGELEDLVWRSLIAVREQEASCVESLVACLADIGSLRAISAKGRVYAYLSTFDPPDRSLGSAALVDGVVPLDSAVFDQLLAAIPRDDEAM